MRFFRIPSFTGIEAHRDDADRGSLRIVEGCLPYGPGGLRSGPVWEKVGDASARSDYQENHLHGADDGKGNSLLMVSRFDEVHELAVVSTENTGIEQFGDPYLIAEPLGMYSDNDAVLSPVGNQLYSFGDGDGEAVFVGKDTGKKVRPDEELYSYEWSKFPNCRFFVQGPKKTIYAAGNPENPLRVYISEPASKTTPFRDSPYSTEEHTQDTFMGEMSVVDILGTNASHITALSSRGDQVVVHTNKGCHLLYAPTSDQADTGYRVEQAPATNFSAAVSSQVVAGETGSMSFWLGHDGQIYKDESASRGAEDVKSYADPAQVSWKAKSVWEKELPVDLSNSFAAYDRESGMYWLFVPSDEYNDWISNDEPGLVTHLKAVPDLAGQVDSLSALPDLPSVVENLESNPGVPGLVENLDLLAAPNSANITDFTALPDLPSVVENETVLPDESGIVENLDVKPDLPGVVESFEAVQPKVGVVTAFEALPDLPGVVDNFNALLLKPEGLVTNFNALPDKPGIVENFSANETPDVVTNFNAVPDLAGVVTNLAVTTPSTALVDLNYHAWGTYMLDPYLLSDGTQISDMRFYFLMKVEREPIPNFRGYRFYRYTDLGFVPRENSPDGPTQIEMLKFWPPEPTGTPASDYTLKPYEIYDVSGLSSNSASSQYTDLNQPIITLTNGSSYTFNIGNYHGGSDVAYRWIFKDGEIKTASEVINLVNRDRENCDAGGSTWYSGGYTNYGTLGSFLGKDCTYVDLSGGEGYADLKHDDRIDNMRGAPSDKTKGLQYTEDLWRLFGSLKTEVGHRQASSTIPSGEPFAGTSQYHELENGVTAPGVIPVSNILQSQLEPEQLPGPISDWRTTLSNGNIEDTVALLDWNDRLYNPGSVVSFAVTMLYEVNGVVYETAPVNKEVSVKFNSVLTYNYETEPTNNNSSPPVGDPDPDPVLPDPPGQVTNFTAVKEPAPPVDLSCTTVDQTHTWYYTGSGFEYNHNTNTFPQDDALYVTSFHSSGIGATDAFTAAWNNSGTAPFPNTSSNWDQYPYNQKPYAVWMGQGSSKPNDGGFILPMGFGNGSYFPDNAWQIWAVLQNNGLGNNNSRTYRTELKPANYPSKTYSLEVYADANGRYRAQLKHGIIVLSAWVSDDTTPCGITGIYSATNNATYKLVVGMRPFGYVSSSKRAGAHHTDGSQFTIPYTF